MKYDIESILEKYEDDYTPSAKVPGPRNMKLAEVPRSEMDNFNTPDLDQGADSILKPGETLEDDFDVTFRKPNAQGGVQQLVSNTVDGSRPGYAGDDEVTKLAKEYQKVTGSQTTLANIKSRIRNNVITKELINKYKSRGAYGSGFRGKEIEAVTNPKLYKTVLSELNKVKKQINKNVLFDYEDVIRTGKWYKNLRTKLGNLNEGDTDTIIKKVLSEEFPGSYYGKTAMRDFRRDKVVKAYLNYLDVNGSLDGSEKRLKELKIFQGTGKKQFRNINESFKEWTKGEFEVEGVDRKKLNQDQLKELKDWSPEYSSTKSVANEKQLKFLDNLNINNPDLSTKEVRQKFFKQFPDVTDGAFNHRITHLTQLKNSGSYSQGGGNTRTFKWATKGDRSPWLKELLGLKFQGNYSSFINRGDKLLAKGSTKEANRLYNAAEKYFGSNGVFTKFEGQGEHPFSRIFGSGPIGNELKINSLVRGDLNSFKRLNFDEPVIQLLTEYNKSTTLPERRNKIKTLIEDRKKLMNYLTESPKEKGIVESVKFNYGPEKMSVSANVVDIDKVKNFNPEDYVKRGESYLKSFETKGKNLLDDSGKIVQKKINVKGLIPFMKELGIKCKLSNGVNCMNPQAYEKSLNELSEKAAQGDQVAKNKLGKFTSKVATSGRVIKNALGPLAIASEVAIEGGIALNKTLETGVPFKQALGESYINKYLLGPKTQIDVEAERAKEFAKGEDFAMAERGRRMAPFMAQSATADAQRLKDRMKQMEKVKTYENFKPNYGFTKEEFEDTMRQIGSLKEDQVYRDDFYKQQVEKPIEFKQLMELPSFKGTQEEFMEGGIASLNVKK